MLTFRNFILFFIFILSVFSLFSQTAVTIDEYGAYFIDNGVIYVHGGVRNQFVYIIYDGPPIGR